MKLDKLGDGGVVLDQEGYELPPNVWTDALNMRMYQGWATSFDGSTRVVAPSVPVYWIAPFYTPTTRYLAYAGLAKVFVHDGVTETDITPATAPTGATTDRWTGGTLSGILVANNQQDAPWSYAGSGVMAALTGWDATWRAKSLRPFKNFLVAMNVTKGATKYPYMVKWSHAADPGALPTSWDATNPALDAGETDLSETPDAIVDCLPLGDVNIIYKERSVYAMQYIGAPFIWRFYRLPGETGILSQNCVASTPLGHVVLAQGDVYLHSGGEPRSIIDQRMRNWLFRTIDQTNYAAAFVVANPRKQEVWVCFPEAGQSSATKALVWNWANDTLAIRELQSFTAGTVAVLPYAGDSWGSDSGAWSADTTSWNDGADFSLNDSRLFLASAATTVGIQGVDTGSLFNGAAISSRMERTGLHLDAPDTVKTITRVWPRVDAVAGTQITVQVGGSMDPETAPTYGAAQTFTVGTDQKVDAFATGRYLAIKLASTARWRMRAMDLDVTQGGRF